MKNDPHYVRAGWGNNIITFLSCVSPTNRHIDFWSPCLAAIVRCFEDKVKSTSRLSDVLRANKDIMGGLIHMDPGDQHEWSVFNTHQIIHTLI